MSFHARGVPSIVLSVTLPLVVSALGVASTVAAQDSLPPTAIEQALIERACRPAELASAVDALRQCLDAKLVSLRADFGRDLSRLTAAQRRRIDASCSRFRAGEQREAYLDCLGGQLSALRVRQPQPAPTASTDAVAQATSQAGSAAPTPPPEERRASSWGMAAAVAGALGIMLAVGGVAFHKAKSRPAVFTCKTCGVEVPSSGLCTACRHEAAEAVRHAAAERAQQQKAVEDDQRRQRELEAEQLEQKARQEQEEQANRVAREQAMLLQEQQAVERQREEEVQPSIDVPAPPAPPAAGEPVFNPYLVLGVSAEASGDDIRHAYEEAKSKYDPDLVSHLGYDAQEHFRLKVESVERAYNMLAAARS